MIGWVGNKELQKKLSAHPRMDEVFIEPGLSGCRFGSEANSRSIEIGNPRVEGYGLLELIDNNPVICADVITLPSLTASGALICLGPLMLAGIVQEAPVLVSSLEFDENEMDHAFRQLGWNQGVLLRQEEIDSPRVLMVSGSAVIQTPEDPEDLADLFEERLGRSLLIDGDIDHPWSSDFVAGRAACSYRISLSQDGDLSLVTVRAICDATGEFQRAQIVNTLNVMNGFEDGLGV